MKKRILALGIVALLGLIQGCGSSDKGSVPQADTGTIGKALISQEKGGAISVTIPDGTLVTLEIPEGALTKSSEITVKAIPEGEMEQVESSKSASVHLYPSISIAIEPSPDLLDAATLSFVFPSKIKKINRFVIAKTGTGENAVKQSLDDNVLKATVYKLGDFVCKVPDTNDMVKAAYRIMDEKPTGDWHDAYSVLDALLYYSGVFSENGKEMEARECVSDVRELCKQSADAFLAKAVQPNTIKDTAYLNALKKYRHLMVLCENPDGIVASLDSRILAMGGE